ncbi:MAG: hypothetical protein AB7P12_11165, partial [Alphaproteobacteria bacterium]
RTALWGSRPSRHVDRPPMAPGLRRFVLFFHITTSVGFLGAVAAYIALAATALTAEPAGASAAWTASAVVAWYVVVPLAFASLIVGVVSGLGTPWGLFRYYWVLAKLFLTIVAVVVLLLQLETINFIASAALEGALPNGDHGAGGIGLLVHGVGGMVVLLIIVVLSIYKPRGLTKYGWRRQSEQRSGA